MTRKILTLLLSTVLVWSSAFVQAESGKSSFAIGILVTKRSPLALSFARELEKRLPDSSVGFYSKDKPYDLIITLGSRAFQKRLESLPEDVATLAVYISRNRFDTLASTPGRCNCRAVYSSAPLLKQALLARELLPKARRVAILSSSAGTEFSDDIVALKKFGFQPTLFKLSEFDSFNQLLLTALSHNDFILGTEDAGIYSSKTIKQILLTSYRHNKVLIGPSPAFVKAGGLATTYVNFDQTLNFVTQQVLVFRKHQLLPPSSYPPEFSIKLNQQVGRSLDILLKPEQQLTQKLMEALQHAKH